MTASNTAPFFTSTAFVSATSAGGYRHATTSSSSNNRVLLPAQYSGGGELNGGGNSMWGAAADSSSRSTAATPPSILNEGGSSSEGGGGGGTTLSRHTLFGNTTSFTRGPHRPLYPAGSTYCQPNTTGAAALGGSGGSGGVRPQTGVAALGIHLLKCALLSTQYASDALELDSSNFLLLNHLQSNDYDLQEIDEEDGNGGDSSEEDGGEVYDAVGKAVVALSAFTSYSCLLYTSDAADEEDSVDLGGRRIIKKKKKDRIYK
eukprot:TRINITY_DN15470_c0_g1_i1.p1 TRINITY_DN15470_c0_g1~~TRINITY_DN15470_c0_g1_i1.p1  ORF type:complete len:261 (+),score=58.49 TRINITY_DN15470_c0_g1_i1:376-1158(+)